MNALTLPDRLQTLEQERQDSSSTQVTRPRFTRARRSSDLRTSFRLTSFEDADLVVEEVRHGLIHDTAGGIAVAEIVATIGDTQFRGYVRPGGNLLIPEILRSHGLEARLAALLAAAGSAAR